MTITAQQLELRRNFLCASDATAVLFGHDGFKSREDVWAEKVFGIEAPAANSAAIQMGNRLEPVIIDWAREQLAPMRIESESPEWIHPAGWMLAHPDGIVADGSALAPLECKYRSLDAGWGEAGGDQVPESVLVQLYVQMLCKSAACGHIAAWLGTKFGMDARMYRVEFDAALGKRVFDELDYFWQRYVVKKQQPPASDQGPSLDVMRRLRRAPDSVVRVDQQVVELYRVTREARLAAEKAEKRAQAELLLQMGGADAGECEGYVVHNKEIKRKGYRVDDSTYRQLSVKERE